ncbi:MAG: BlaI/MecI/CopY family transcriptional regulator [Eubacteriales bacterium]|nr:BlaI/MecI/CopY family transcriptional regulator [Eubacteriales bacterium]
MDMKNNIKRLPDSELEIMMLIWEAKEPVSSAYLMEKLQGEKNWVATTVLNFLARLVERGFLRVEKRGRINIYSPLVLEKDYIEIESRTFLERLHKSSLKSFVAALYDGKKLSNEDAEELKNYIDELTKPGKSKGE